MLILKPDRFHLKVLFRTILMVLLLPLVLPTIPLALLIIAILYVVTSVLNYVGERRFRSRMRRCGRFLQSRDACQRIESEGGTLLIERPALGWNVTSAWWTPEDLPAKSPFPVPTDEDYKKELKEMRKVTGLWCLAWDKWCWDNYTSPVHGRAFLLQVRNGKNLEPKLKALFPNLRIVRAWTGPLPRQGPPHDPTARAT